MSNSLFAWLWVTMSKFIKCSKTGSIYLFYYKKSYLKPEINKNPSKIKELECLCIIKYCCYDAYCQTTTKLWLATAKTCFLLTGMQVGQWSYGTAFSGDSSSCPGQVFLTVLTKSENQWVMRAHWGSTYNLLPGMSLSHWPKQITWPCPQPPPVNPDKGGEVM